MPTNDFNKEERVAWEDICEAFEDDLSICHNFSTYTNDSREMERQNNVIWRPMPYIMQSQDGMNQTGNFQGATQLSVPASLGYYKSVPWELNAMELRDALQENRLGLSARQKIASDINTSCANVAALQGTIVVKRTAAATGYDDVSECEATMDELGIVSFDRIMGLSARDHNKMAGNLAARETINDMPTKAYRQSYVGNVANFETFRVGSAPRLTAKTAATVTFTSDVTPYVPAATQTAATGETSNVDNRYQNISVTVGSGTIAVGDCFTAGVNSVHHITKQDTGQLKTYRVHAIVSGGGGTGVITISPPFISGEGGTDAELQYQNCTAAPVATDAITFLNTVTAYANPFWQKDALEILPGRIALDDAGLAVMRYTTPQGIELVFAKQTGIGNFRTQYRMDAFWGVCNKQPEMSGIMLFSQT